MRIPFVVAGLAAASALSAQSPLPGKTLGSWAIEYDVSTSPMHGEAVLLHERGQLKLRSVGDSVFGELVIGDSATAHRLVMRGLPAKPGWTLYAEEPAPTGFGLFS